MDLRAELANGEALGLGAYCLVHPGTWLTMFMPHVCMRVSCKSVSLHVGGVCACMLVCRSIYGVEVYVKEEVCV